MRTLAASQCLVVSVSLCVAHGSEQDSDHVGEDKLAEAQASGFAQGYSLGSLEGSSQLMVS